MIKVCFTEVVHGAKVYILFRPHFIYNNRIWPNLCLLQGNYTEEMTSDQREFIWFFSLHIFIVVMCSRQLSVLKAFSGIICQQTHTTKIQLIRQFLDSIQPTFGKVKNKPLTVWLVISFYVISLASSLKSSWYDQSKATVFLKDACSSL